MAKVIGFAGVDKHDIILFLARLLGEFIVDGHDIRMVVDTVDKNRIDKVHLYLPEIQDAPLDEDSSSPKD